MTHGFNIARTLSHERLDDEVIAIDLQTGVYYALDDVAADCWSVAAAGGGVEAMVQFVADRYGVAAEVIRDEIATFVNELLDAGLLSSGGDAAAIDLVVEGPAAPYAAPQLATYDDLETLLLIDPIHEVDDAGWPVQPGAHDAS